MNVLGEQKYEDAKEVVSKTLGAVVFAITFSTLRGGLRSPRNRRVHLEH